jgi:hypothetical protein
MEKNEIDRLITESLSREEAEFYRSLDEEGLSGKVRSLYTGKMGWMAVVTAIVNVAAAAISVYCLIMIFTLPETVDIIRYLSVLIIAWSFGCMVKLWQWMQMDKDSIIREMKRLEFQVAILSEKRSDK